MLVIGHKNPDTDSVVSAIVWAQIQQKLGIDATPGIAGQINNETQFILDHFGVKIPAAVDSVAGRDIFLVDHNSLLQSPAGAEKANLRGCLDHHLLAGAQSAEPIYFRCEPVGSTSTLVASFALENDIKLNQTQASLLLAGILSDTLNFTSPTSTPKDKKIAQILAKDTGIKIDDLAAKMFEAKSSLAGVKVSEIVSKDYKEFEFGKTKFGFGVWETVMPKSVLEKKEEIKEALRKLQKSSKMDCMFFAVVDILKQQSYVIVISQKERDAIEHVFKTEIKDSVAFLEGVVSRKKQIIPPLAEYFEKLN